MITTIFQIIDRFYKKKDGAKIVARNNAHLINLIKKEVQLNGYECDLNHIDISHITDLQGLFYKSKFNGNISEWNTSNIVNMGHMFAESLFNGDISNWDTSNVKNMHSMFAYSEFNNDISRWNLSNVLIMSEMFKSSKFNQDISAWDVSQVANMCDIFLYSEFKGDILNWKPCKANIGYMRDNGNMPYWAVLYDKEERKKIIDMYHLEKELSKDLVRSQVKEKRMKI